MNQGDFEILVLGESPVTEELTAMAQAKRVGDRPIKVSKINTVAEIKKCHILFIPASQSDKFNEIQQRVAAKAILIMTEQAGLGSLGSCVNFITKDGKLAFELNQAALSKQNLKASLELTRIAIMI
jgi:glutamine amidotransferase PdxT